MQINFILSSFHKLVQVLFEIMGISRENTHGEGRGRSLNVCRDLKPNQVRVEGGPALLQQQFDYLLVAMQYPPVEALEIHTSTLPTMSFQYPKNSKFKSKIRIYLQGYIKWQGRQNGHWPPQN